MAVTARIPWARFGNWMLKSKLWLVAVLKPLGVWGLCGLAIVDASSIPLPFIVDPLVVSYGLADHKRFLLYSFMAALGAAIGGMLPYYLGRAGGELFLLKRIDRARYEQLRDRFEKQEFFAIMLPAMAPPPMPVKLFMLAAGVFEMRPLSYFLAMLAGKTLRFAIESIVVIVYGPAILHTGMQAVHRHAGWVMTGVGLLLLLLVVWVVRKSMAGRNTREPLGEDEEEGIG